MNTISSYGRVEYKDGNPTGKETWVTPDQVKEQGCPVCPAGPGENCRARIANGHTRSMWKLHSERRDLAFDRYAGQKTISVERP